MQDLIAGSIEEIRELSYRLRPATLEEFGLAKALQNLTEEMAGGAGLTVKTNLKLDCKLPSQSVSFFCGICAAKPYKYHKPYRLANGLVHQQHISVAEHMRPQ